MNIKNLVHTPASSTTASSSSSRSHSFSNSATAGSATASYPSSMPSTNPAAQDQNSEPQASIKPARLSFHVNTRKYLDHVASIPRPLVVIGLMLLCIIGILCNLQHKVNLIAIGTRAATTTIHKMDPMTIIDTKTSTVTVTATPTASAAATAWDDNVLREWDRAWDIAEKKWEQNRKPVTTTITVTETPGATTVTRTATINVFVTPTPDATTSKPVRNSSTPPTTAHSELSPFWRDFWADPGIMGLVSIHRTVASFVGLGGLGAFGKWGTTVLITMGLLLLCIVGLTVLLFSMMVVGSAAFGIFEAIEKVWPWDLMP